MSKDTGGSAFPLVTETYNDETREVISANRIQNGITKRDYFAAKAMQSLIVTQLEGEIGDDKVKGFFDICSEYAYIAADAMIEARNK